MIIDVFLFILLHPDRLRDHTGEDQHVSVQRPKGGRQSQAQRIGRYARYHTHTSLKIIHAKLAVDLVYAKVLRAVKQK